MSTSFQKDVNNATEYHTLTDIVGYFAGTLLMMSFLPQVIMTYRIKHANDVSIWMLSITLGSALLYDLYAWRLGLIPVLIMNSIFAFLVIIEIALKIYYSVRKQGNFQMSNSG